MELTKLTGKPPIPNIQSLGFHFSTWDNSTAKRVMERSRNFTKFGFPVDYLWLDLPYTDQGNYLDFNPKTFPTLEKLEMEAEL